MQKPKSTFYLLCYFICLVPCLSSAQGFLQANHAYWYQPAGPESSLLLWQPSADSLGVMATVQLKENQAIENYEIYLHLLQRIDSVAGLAIPIPISPVEQQGERYFFKTTIAPPDSLNYLLLEIKPFTPDTLNSPSYWAMAVLDPERSFPPPPFYLQQAEEELPLFQDYITADTPLRLTGDPQNYTVFQYRQVFEPAAPPMAPPNGSSNLLEVDSTFSLPAGSLFRLSQEGLYFFQHDTTQLSGRSLRVTGPYFPEVGRLENFVGPIRYLSTKEEWKRLQAADFSKKAVDHFWLSIGQSQERARRIIKAYYQQVAEANRLFTSYKAGWKTDQGMIYILYGAPDAVTVEEGKEEWIYRKTARNPEIKFTFVRVKNPFTDHHMVLVRSKEYTRSHYQIVSQWRRGIKTL